MSQKRVLCKLLPWTDVTVGTCIWALKPIVAKGTAVVVKGIAEPYTGPNHYIYPLRQQTTPTAFSLQTDTD